MAAAAAVVLVAAGAGVYQWQVRQAEGMRAKEDVMRALRLTSEKLQTASETHVAQIEDFFASRYDAAELAELNALLSRVEPGDGPAGC